MERAGDGNPERNYIFAIIIIRQDAAYNVIGRNSKISTTTTAATHTKNARNDIAHLSEMYSSSFFPLLVMPYSALAGKKILTEKIP